jgi:hypothetical protein
MQQQQQPRSGKYRRQVRISLVGGLVYISLYSIVHEFGWGSLVHFVNLTHALTWLGEFSSL